LPLLAAVTVPLIAPNTVNGTGVLVSEPTVTASGPGAAPTGTGTVIWLAVTLVGVELTPLNVVEVLHGA